MKIYEIGTGYTSIPAKISAATELVVEELTKAFIKLNTNVTILDIEDSSRKSNSLPIQEISIPSKFASTDVELGIMHKLKRVVYSISLAKHLKKILLSTEEKVVFHFHNQYNLFFFIKLTSKKQREKCIIAYTNHSGVWSQPWDIIQGTIKKRYFQEAYAMRYADLVFVLNKDMKANIVKYDNVKEENVKIINNGVNTDVYIPLKSKEESKKKYGLEGKKVILQVGSVYENKGQKKSVEYLLPAMKENESLVYVFAGGIVDQEYYNSIINYAKENGVENQVKYAGMIAPGEELCQLYNAASYTIFLSEYESFGLVVIESLSCGVPVLLRENFVIDFGDGIKIMNKDTITQIINDDSDYALLSSKARENALQTYTWESVAKSINEEISKVE